MLHSTTDPNAKVDSRKGKTKDTFNNQ